MKLEIEQTCMACPEQYNINLEDERVAYVRLRWGYLEVCYKEPYGDLIYDEMFENEWKGCFDCIEERTIYMEIIRLAVEDYLNKKQKEEK